MDRAHSPLAPHGALVLPFDSVALIMAFVLMVNVEAFMNIVETYQVLRKLVRYSTLTQDPGAWRFPKEPSRRRPFPTSTRVELPPPQSMQSLSLLLFRHSPGPWGHRFWKSFSFPFFSCSCRSLRWFVCSFLSSNGEKILCKLCMSLALR